MSFDPPGKTILVPNRTIGELGNRFGEKEAATPGRAHPRLRRAVLAHDQTRAHLSSGLLREAPPCQRLKF